MGLFNLSDRRLFKFSKGGDPIPDMGIGMVASWLKEYHIKDYEVNGKTIDLEGDVDLVNKDLEAIPEYIVFNKVSGNFWCDGNKLTLLKGCPREVGGSFSCTGNPLSSLDGLPDSINGNTWI